MAKKIHPLLTEQEREIVKMRSGTTTLVEVAKELGWNYTNLSTALKQQRIAFQTKKAERVPRSVESSEMKKEKGENGKRLLTDKMMKEWFPY